MHRLKENGNSMVIPAAAAECLRTAGWTPARAVSPRIFEEAYRSEGRLLLPTTKEFLQKFGGLIIPYPTKSNRADVLAFLADRVVHAMGGSGVECFEELIGVAPLCPIGHYQFGTCILFMDARGCVFGGSDETITLIGRNGEEAICNILTAVDSEVIEPKTTSKRA